MSGLSVSDLEAVRQSCGACCSTSYEWPRFTLEDDAAIARIPAKYVDASGARMRCRGDRCSALVGVVGDMTSCAIYADRPDVCRACVPGDDACQIARGKFAMKRIVTDTCSHNVLDTPPASQ